MILKQCLFFILFNEIEYSVTINPVAGDGGQVNTWGIVLKNGKTQKEIRIPTNFPPSPEVALFAVKTWSNLVD